MRPSQRGALIAVRRAAYVTVVPARLHPGALLRCAGWQEYATDDGAVLQHVEMVIAPHETRVAVALHTSGLPIRGPATADISQPWSGDLLDRGLHGGVLQ